ncbi:uncharacterized protein LOC124796116 [Schistocerca piceifrons]|uniref:uncharacterized protein LOC124796116 n=1 Tax=Schistocerca piceifrons TaxID=274613 RepID=UPI001F5F5EDE|nr:uncharacterized protein LOC124796116 [Schistocerca piceifrons]
MDAKVGLENEGLEHIMGVHSIGNTNVSGELLDMTAEYDLVIGGRPGSTLPGNFSSLALEKAKVLTVKEKKHEFKLPEVPNIFIKEKQSGPTECCRLRARAPLKDCAARRRWAARTQFEEHAQRSNCPAQLQFIQHSDSAAVDPELNSWNMVNGLKYHV